MLSRTSLICSGAKRVFSSVKNIIDYSKVPVIAETDLEEQFVKGSGPGGQKINKTSSCVFLKHLPTGIVLKCQETRFLEKNRKKARELMTTKVDNFINGDDSIEAQIKAIADKKTRHRFISEQSDSRLLASTKRLIIRLANRQYSCAKKSTIDYSKVPEINPKDIEEQHVGGSASTTAAKTMNGVLLKHIPSGIVVKCIETRFLEINKTKAMEMLVVKVDNWLNGENSVEAQKKKLLDKKSSKNKQKKEKLRQLKEQWKERENIT